MSSMRMGPKAGSVVKKSAVQEAKDNAEKQKKQQKEEPISVKEARRYRYEFHQIYENYVVQAFSESPRRMDWEAARRMLLRACGAIITCDYQPPIDRDSRAVAVLVARIVSRDEYGKKSALGGKDVVPFIAGRVRMEQRMENVTDSANRRREIVNGLRSMGPAARARALVRWYDPRRR